MGAVLMQLRAEARARWRAWLGLAIVLALIGGGAIAAAAGARRTLSAYPRFLDRYYPYDASINAGGQDADRIFAAIAKMPIVEETSRFALLVGSVRAPSGEVFEFPDVFFLTEVGLSARGSVKVLEGAVPSFDASDEVMVNYLMAERLGVRTGSRVEVTVRTLFPADPPLEPKTSTVRVTGVYAAVGEFESLRENGFPTTMKFASAFLRAHEGYHQKSEDNLSVWLRGGAASVGEFERELERRFDFPEEESPETPQAFTAAVQELNRLPALTLWLLAVFLALAIVVIVGQSLSREEASRATDMQALRALGLSGAQRAAQTVARAALIVFPGAAGAVLVGWALSPVSPVGLARIAEPDPGFAFDATALPGGAAAVVVAIVIAIIPSAWRAGRARASEGSGRRSAIADGLARASAPSTIVTGVGFALRSGRGRASVPVRTTVLGSAIAVAMVVASLVFAGSMDRLRTDPRLSGFVWDAEVEPNLFGPSEAALIAEQARLEDEARSVPGVAAAWGGNFFQAVCVGRSVLTVTSYETGDLALVRGRAPNAANEVALDARTMREARVAVGDEIGVRSTTGDQTCPESAKGRPERMMEITGRFVPARHPFLGANAGQAVAMTEAGLREHGQVYDGTYVRFEPGVDLQEGVARLREHFGDEIFAVVSRNQNTGARNVSRIAQLPLVLASVLGLLALATLVHTLLLTIRRRRGDLAILKTLGFVGRQVRATVAWQATVLVLLALIVGVPAGIAAGRWAWVFFADEVEVVPLAVVSPVLVPMIVAGALFAANVIAALPARAAARTHPAVVLRTE